MGKVASVCCPFRIAIRWGLPQGVCLRLFRQFLVDLPDIVQHFVASGFLVGTRNEVGGQLFPCVLEGIHPSLGRWNHFRCCQFVGFGEDDGEGNAALSEPVNEIPVNLLRIQTDVYEYENVYQLLSLEDIAAYHLVKLLLDGLASLGEPIAGQVNQIPFPIDEEVVDEEGLARCGTGFGQSFVVA